MSWRRGSALTFLTLFVVASLPIPWVHWTLSQQRLT